MEQNEATYIKGFNAGHRLQSFEPELVALLLPSLHDKTDYEKGLRAGVEQRKKELEKEKGRLTELSDLRNSKPKDKEKDRDR